jgi:hypothetical protein
LGKVAVNPNNSVSRDPEGPKAETIEEYSLSVWVFGRDAQPGCSWEVSEESKSRRQKKTERIGKQIAGVYVSSIAFP